MRSIHRLSPHIVNKIAAGEVIARPASVVKELLENALDAQASSIEIQVEEGGKKRISVIDDGRGIAWDDLPLAFDSHCTSKIRNDDDLFRIQTLGFRGEALASIASVSQARILSRTPDSISGAEICAEGGKIGEAAPSASPVGTTVEARNLFYNTPVRRKFLKNDATELGHITDIVSTLALAHPRVGFTLRHNDRELFRLPPEQTLVERVRQLFSGDLTKNLMEVGHIENGIEVFGYIAPLEQTRGNARMQFTFLNGRHLRDKVINHAIQQAFYTALMPGRYPVLFLFVHMPPDEVDVNVHPTKTEVRFKQSGNLHNVIAHAIRQTISGTEFPAQAKALGFKPIEARNIPTTPQNLQQAMHAYLRNTPAQQAGGQKSFLSQTPPPAVAPNSFDGISEFPASAPASIQEGLLPNAEEIKSCVQVFNTYLIEETEGGISLTDQHALHERILYEEIQERIAAAPLESQKLLIPETIALESQAEADILLNAAPELARLGLTLEELGPKTLVLRAAPKILKRVDYQELLRAIAHDLKNDKGLRGLTETKDYLISLIACKAAIKGGDKLTQEEIEYLLQNRKKAFMRHSCPHGRPTTLFLSLSDIERQFLRT